MDWGFHLIAPMCPQIPERFATSAPVPPPKCVPTDAMDTAPRAPRRRGWRALLPAGLALIIAARLWAHFPVSEVTNNSHANSHANNSVFGDADSPPDFPLTGAPDGASWSHFRLPRHAVPSHYRITLATELYADEFHDGGEGIGTGSSASPFEFAGFVEMDFVVLNSTDFMVINAADLQLGRAEIAVRGPREESPVFHPVPQNVTSDEQILLRFSSPAFSPPANTSPSVLEPGTSYTLRIAFSGVLEESLMGYYRSSYERGGRTHWLGSTQFEVCLEAFDHDAAPAHSRRRNQTVNRRSSGLPLPRRTHFQGSLLPHFLHQTKIPHAFQHA